MLLAAAKGDELKGWKIVIGGAAFPTALAEAALARGLDVFAGYGMSETCPLLTVSHVTAAQDDVATRAKAGMPVPLVELRTVDGAMEDAPSGEVVVRAPWLTQGYLGDAEASARLWQGGWLHTGDIGQIGADGRLAITDRIKDVIKSGGEWVSSVALEDIILQHPAVAEVAVIGMPDPKWSERPLALVVAKGSCDAAAISAHVQGFADRGAICKLAVPTRVKFVNQLPRTSVGKLDKKAMRAKYLT